MRTSRRDLRKKRKDRGLARIYWAVAVVLILAGLGVLGYAGVQWLEVQYHQARLREDFQSRAAFRLFFALEEEERPVEITQWQPMWLSIPAIEVELGVLSDIDTYDPDEVGNEPWNFPDHIYRRWVDDLSKLLDKGPVFYQLGDLPSSVRGNVVIAGHRAGRWNFFRDLDKLEAGDEIYLDVDGYRFTYVVEGVEQVSANDWTMFFSTEQPSITLQTCTPLGVPNPPYRLNARGVLQAVTPTGEPATPDVE